MTALSDEHLGVRLTMAEKYALRVMAQMDHRYPSTYLRALLRKTIKSALDSGTLKLPPDVIDELNFENPHPTRAEGI